MGEEDYPQLRSEVLSIVLNENEGKDTFQEKLDIDSSDMGDGEGIDYELPINPSQKNSSNDCKGTDFN